MSELDGAIRRVRVLSSDGEAVEAIVGKLREADERARAAEKALTLIVFAGFLIPQNTPRLSIDGSVLERLTAEGLLSTDYLAGEPSHELSVKGDSFIRKSILELAKANRMVVGAE